jgi:hypothetical protein
LKLNTENAETEKRLHVLEMAVYKKDPTTGKNTLIDKMEDDIRNV